MPKSYRIRTQPGVDKNIRVEINQDFDFLEILSLKLRQEDVYTRFCADYGVVVGRVITNGGYGIPNAKISVFVPLDSVDENDPIISTLYPYRNLGQKNEDGYRYNLLPYEQSYQGHTPTGTFPTEDDILTRQEVLEVYEKYYKYTVKTNESGDFMIIGVPLGMQKVVMDLDLSDMGCFSLRPSDLIRMGLASETQVAGQEFRASTDLFTLPQIVNGIKDADVASFWGQEDLCTIGITRVDFDLRDYGISIQPHAVFMGSLFSTPDEDSIREGCGLKNDYGRLCQLTTGPGQILSIRQTIGVDADGRPVLEEYKLENGGNIIDSDGAWLIELPMNLDYVVTNEFGEQVLSNDPSVGVPTSSKYRFKIKWQNEGGLQNEVQRANYLVPNIKEYYGSGIDTNASYAFSLDWNDYGDKLFNSQTLSSLGQIMVNEAINCEDRFYEFHYNKVYTISSHVDRFKFGFGDKKHIGIKNIDDSICKNSTNKFPVNDGEQNSGGIFLLDIIMFIIRAISIPLLFILHTVFLIMTIIISILNVIFSVLRWFGLDSPLFQPIALPTFNLPMISYPDCENCNCGESYNTPPNSGVQQAGANLSVLGNISDRGYFSNYAPTNDEDFNKKLRWLLSGNELANNELERVPYFNYGSGDWGAAKTPNLAQKVNLANQRQRYFRTQQFQYYMGLGSSQGEANIIRTTVKNTIPNTTTVQYSDPLYDNVMILLCDPGTLQSYGVGSIITFSDVSKLDDPNITGNTINQFSNNATTGTSQYNSSALINVPVTNIKPNGSVVTANVKILSNESSEKYFNFKTGVEYFQIITGSTINSWKTIIGGSSVSLLKNHTYGYQQQLEYNKGTISNTQVTVTPMEQVPDYLNYEIILLTRGVDPFTQRQNIEYDLSPLFGRQFGNIKVEGSYYLNIPMQQTSPSSTSTNTWRTSWLTPESHNITDNNNTVLFHPSFTFTPSPSKFIPFYSKELLRYSRLDKSTQYFTALPNDQPEYPKTYTLNGFTQESWDRPNGTNYLTQQGFIEGAALQSLNGIAKNKKGRIYSPVYYNGTTVYNGSNGIQLSNSYRIIFRSDRLPTSDQVENFRNSSYLLHQNQKFAMYALSDGGDITYQPQVDFGTNNTTTSQDFTGQTTSQFNNVVTSMSCNGMVRLSAYQGYGKNLTIDENKNEDAFGRKHVENGCYQLVKIPFVDLVDGTDISLFLEWYSRYRMMAAVCNGALAQMFQNNWVNGTLYMPSFDKGAVFDTNNEVSHYTYCGNPENLLTGGAGPIHFNTESNNFYYKSTRFDNNSNRFVGQEKYKFPVINLSYPAVNDRNLWFPTTIMDLGPRDQFTKQICFDPNFEGYLVDTLKTTSYSDTSDIVNMFILSRLSNSTWLGRLFNAGNSSINALFSRDGDRVDGDVAQLFSINSEFGVVPFLGTNYSDDKLYVGQDSKSDGPVLGIFFDSNRELRQLLSPGKTPYTVFGYPKTQVVPFYRWQVESTTSIFGNEDNNWLTGTPIVSSKYQNLDFDNSPYFKVTNGQNLGYIYNRGPNGNPLESWPTGQNIYFLEGAPYHFYFGLKRGKSAMNRFITKYII